VAPEVGLRFADTSYSVQVPENATFGYKIKTLTIVNSKTHGGNIPLKCLVISGNSESELSTRMFWFLTGLLQGNSL
jgi:protocadherin-15